MSFSEQRALEILRAMAGSTATFHDGQLEAIKALAGKRSKALVVQRTGHDFRPDYRRIVDVLSLLPDGVPALATTATANDRVVEDLQAQLGSNLETFRGTLERESLSLSVITDLPSQSQRMAWLAQNLDGLPGSGIIYTLTIRDADRVAGWLQERGIGALAYSGDLETDFRLDAEARLLSNEVKVVVATSALGMGFDKPDVGFVIHYQSPSSSIAYYQQVGRAGRAVDTSYGILMAAEEDKEIQDYFIETAFPLQRDSEAVVELLARAGVPTRETDILSKVNISQRRLRGLLKVLEVEGVVERGRQGWLRTLNPWSYDTERVNRGDSTTPA